MTPALEEFFVGYAQNPAAILQKSFNGIEGYDEMIVLRGVHLESNCEHHMAPILGRAWVAYVPNGRADSRSAINGCPSPLLQRAIEAIEVRAPQPTAALV